MTTAHHVPFPQEAGELAGLGRGDHEEAFAFDADRDLTAEAWTRLILEGAPEETRAMLLAGWGELGVQLAPLDDEGQVLGWRILHNTPEATVVGVESTLGLAARSVLLVNGRTVIHAMQFRFDREEGRNAFMPLAETHSTVVASLIENAIRLSAETISS